MSDEIKKPNVFPNQTEIDEANSISEKLNKQIFDKLQETGAYNELTNNNSVNENVVSQGELDAAAEMKRKTDELIRIRQEKLDEIASIADETERRRLLLMGADKPYVYRPELAEDDRFQSEIQYGHNTIPKPEVSNFKTVIEPERPYVDIEKTLVDLEAKYEKLGQPQQNVPFDVIPLPSLGKLYPNKRPTIKIAYLNASDENILTNPNLLQSGKFLEILINRKMMDTNLRYKDLHVGDRNAIMIWLRSTAYGSQYPISVYDPATGLPFETNIDLGQLKMIELKVDTDVKGHISFILPISKNEIKFKFLTVGDLDEIDAHTERINNDKNLGPEFLDTNTFILKKQIVSINGHTDRNVVEDFVDQMLLGDVKAFRKYVDEIESGMDMNLTVGTPGGESIKTFLPLNVNFFWPDL